MATEAGAVTRAPAKGSSDAARAPFTVASATPAHAAHGTRRQPLPTSAAAKVDSLREETQLLEQARSQLARNPRHALALAAEHERRFVRGQLLEQRRLIQLEALLRLGQDERALRLSEGFQHALSKARAGALLQRYGVASAGEH